jgi:molybdopterin-guanine dinucleotide biosynthesis protein A
LTIQVAWARATLECPAVQAFVASYDAPLTVSRIVSNLIHAASNSQLRIDPDPERAYHQMCGPGTPTGVRLALQAP